MPSSTRNSRQGFAANNQSSPVQPNHQQQRRRQSQRSNWATVAAQPHQRRPQSSAAGGNPDWPEPGETAPPTNLAPSSSWANVAAGRSANQRPPPPTTISPRRNLATTTASSWDAPLHPEPPTLTPSSTSSATPTGGRWARRGPRWSSASTKSTFRGWDAENRAHHHHPPMPAELLPGRPKKGEEEEQEGYCTNSPRRRRPPPASAAQTSPASNRPNPTTSDQQQQEKEEDGEAEFCLPWDTAESPAEKKARRTIRIANILAEREEAEAALLKSCRGDVEAARKKAEKLYRQCNPVDAMTAMRAAGNPTSSDKSRPPGYW